MTGIPPLSIGRAAAGEYVIDIPNWQPTPLNKLLGHWANSARLKKSDLKMIWGYAKQAKIPAATSKRSLQLIIQLAPRQRAFDPDAPFKSVCDALVHCGLLTDDNRQGVELLPVKFERGAQKATRIVLRDVA